MSDILNKTIVLVPNRNWRSINIRKPRNALCQMATNVATTPDIAFDETSESTPFDAPHWESERWNRLRLRYSNAAWQSGNSTSSRSNS